MEISRVETTLNPIHEALYQKCISINPGLTRGDWTELRNLSLAHNTPGITTLYEKFGIIVDTKPDAETMEEINPLK